MNVATHLPKGLRQALICLRVSEALYVLLALLFAIFGATGLFGLPPDTKNNSELVFVWGMVFFLIFMSIGMAIFIEIVCRHLKRGKYWAWIAGLILCGIYIPSLFFILGIVGLIGLLKPESKSFFETQKSNSN